MEPKHIKIDWFQKTTENVMFACCDNTSMMRSVPYAIAMGGISGSMLIREIIEHEFQINKMNWKS